MILAAILTGIIVVISNLFALFLINRRITREKEQVTSLIQAYFMQPDKDTPSEFAATIESISAIFAAKITQSIKGMALGMQSVDAKNERKLEGDIIQDIVAAQNPLAGLLLSQFPSVAKRLQKSPHLLGMAQQMIGKLTAQPQPQADNNHKEQLKLEW